MKSLKSSLEVATDPDLGERVTPKPSIGFKWFGSTLAGNREISSVFWTFLTTLTIYGVFLVQGVIVARILGPVGRGEFGTALYFPRDILLYAGLLGGIEVVNRYASRGLMDHRWLRYSAAQLGFFTGSLTAVIAALFSIVFLSLVGKTYLIPYCLVCCLFVPWEHMQLTISGVDRGMRRYANYNLNRFIFAISFPVLLLLVFPTGLFQFVSLPPLWIVCTLFVVSKVIGVAPTLREMRWRGNPAFNQARLPAANKNFVHLRKWLRRGRPYALSVLATEFFERLDVLLIVALASVEQSGHYFVAVPAASLLIIAPNALGVFTFNAGADRSRHVGVRQAVLILVVVGFVQIVAAILLGLILPHLIPAIFGSQFEPAVVFALWLLPASAIRGFLQAVDGYLKGSGRPLVGVRVRTGSIIAMLVFVSVAYPVWGLISIPMAACFGQAISMVVITCAAVGEIIRRSKRAGEARVPGVGNE